MNYLGICDFTSADEVRTMQAVLRSQDNFMTLGVGVMMSYKTLNGLPTRWSPVFPKKETIADIFSVEAEDVYNILHYADYEGVDIAKSLCRAAGYGGPNLHAIQLDMVWPDLKELYKFRRTTTADVILQVGPKAMEQLEYNFNKVTDKLRTYVEVTNVTGILLDASAGKGVAFKDEHLELMGRIIDACGYFFSDEHFIVIAGGLGPGSLDQAHKLSEPAHYLGIPVCLDAQSKLRRSGNAIDPIDWDLAEAYLREAAQINTSKPVEPYDPPPR